MAGMERRQLHPLLAWFLAASLIGWVLSRIGVALNWPAVSENAAFCPLIGGLACGVWAAYRWYRGVHRPWVHRAIGAVQFVILLVVTSVAWLAAELYAEYRLLSHADARVIALADEQGWKVYLGWDYPFFKYPPPLRYVRYHVVQGLELPSDDFLDHEAGIKALPGIGFLSLTGGTVDEAIIQALAKFGRSPDLEGITIQGSKIRCALAESLTDLPHLTFLGLENCELLVPQSPLLESLGTIPSLRSISLAGTAIDKEGAQAIGDLGQVRGLSLARTGIGDDAIERLLALESLEVVDLSGTRLSAAGLGRLTRHPALRAIFAEDVPLDMATLDANLPPEPKIQIHSQRFDELSKAAQLYHSARSWSARAAHTADPHDFAVAHAAFSRGIEIDPSYVWFFLLRGELLEERGLLAEAERDFTAAIELEPENAICWNYRAGFHHEHGDSWAAIQDANRAIALDPKFVEAYSLRGSAWLRIGQPLGAIEDYTATLGLRPTWPENRYWRGLAYTAIDDWNAAIRDFTDAIVQEPEAREAYAGRATAYEHVGRPDLAEARLRVDATNQKATRKAGRRRAAA